MSRKFIGVGPISLLNILHADFSPLNELPKSFRRDDFQLNFLRFSFHTEYLGKLKSFHNVFPHNSLDSLIHFQMLRRIMQFYFQTIILQ